MHRSGSALILIDWPGSEAAFMWGLRGPSGPSVRFVATLIQVEDKNPETTPPSTPNFLTEDFYLYPSLACRFSLRRIWSDTKSCSHCNFQNIHWCTEKFNRLREWKHDSDNIGIFRTSEEFPLTIVLFWCFRVLHVSLKENADRCDSNNVPSRPKRLQKIP